ncbi:hypothetical protein [Corynebacterium sp. A21]|uniref:hypothetical protein n=1 Tax=Corynebacterium sp. A21 TaxID=3457318 RepID=UPI003FCF1705
MISTALSTAFSLVASLLSGSSGEETPTEVAQVAIAVPGGQWVGRGELTEELAAWSTANMSPGDTAQRTYLVRNLDARAGTWEVRLGDYEISEHGYFGVGTEAQAVSGSAVPGEFEIPAPGPGETTWLLGTDAAARENLVTAEPGHLLARIEIGSCEVAGLQDSLRFPDVSANEYQGQSVEPKLQVSFTPIGDESQEFIDGECDGAAAPAPGSSGSSGPSISYWPLLLWAVGGFLLTVGSWWPWLLSLGTWVQGLTLWF